MAVDGWCDDEGAACGLKKTGANPTDRGKQGVKRSLLTDAKGIPLAVVVEGANRHDMKLVRATLAGIKANRPQPKATQPQGLSLDKEYDYEEVRPLLVEFGFTAQIKRPRPQKSSPQGLCMDKGYDYDEVREIVKSFGFTAHIRTRGEEARAIKRQAGFRARRWVVERTHSWLNRFRRILVRWEKRVDTYLGMLHLALGIITWNATGLLG